MCSACSRDWVICQTASLGVAIFEREASYTWYGIRFCMKLTQSIFEALALLVLACVVGLTFNARRSAGAKLDLMRNYFPVLKVSNSNESAEESNSADATALEHGFNVVSLSEALDYYSRGESSIVFIDARDDADYQKCHIPNAIQFDYYHPDNYMADVRDFAGDAEIVILYCNGGECEDSIQAARYLTEEIDDPLPFDIVYVFEGGIQDWYQAGYEREPENCEP